MKQVLSELDAPDQPVILFANPSVLDFYPRFGFRRLAQDRFIARANLNPMRPPAPTLNITRPTDRAWLADHCGRAGFVGQGFAARDYYPVLLFHLTCQPRTAFRLESFGAVVIARQDGERLLIDDLLATRPFSLRDALPHVCRHPVRTVEFGFHPEAWWQDAESLSFDDDGAPLVTPQCQMDHQLRMPIAVTVHRVRAALEALGIEFLDITRDRASASACRASAPQTWVFRGRELLRTLSAATGGFIEGRRG
jgi:hypothetical protein